MPTDEIIDALKENATGPKKASGDEGSVEQHALGDVIEADRYIKNTQASRRPFGGVRMTKLIPPGTEGG